MQTLQQLTERIFFLPSVHQTDRPILAAVIGDEQTLLIDAGNSNNHAKRFKEELNKNEMKGDLIALTHSHWDHVFGLKEMQLAAVSNHLTSERVKNMQFLLWTDEALDSRVENGTESAFSRDKIKLELGTDRNVSIAEPTIVFEEEITIDLGGVTCTLEHVEADHSPDSTIIFVQEEKILFLGDCLYANMDDERWYYTEKRIIPLLEKINQYDADYFILSHEQAPMTKEIFDDFSNRLQLSVELMKANEGNLDQMITAFPSIAKRDISENDIELLTYFANGYKM